MKERARMTQLLAEMERAPEPPRPQPEPEAKAAEETNNQKTRERKTRKPVFGKVAKRKIETVSAESATPLDIDRPYGERGDFEKVTVTLPSDVRALLWEESMRRKKNRDKNWPIAQIVRECIAAQLSGKR
jgi:hypothetical protein